MGNKPQLECRDVKRLLKLLGFKFDSQSGSHEHYVMVFRGKYRKVTVDCPKAPFSETLIRSMAAQAGLTVAEFYQSHSGKVPKR